MKPLVWHRHRSLGDHTMPTIDAYPYVITVSPNGANRFSLRRYDGLWMNWIGDFRRAADAKLAAEEHRKGNG